MRRGVSTNVLDLVANKSRVLRFQDCIQCEACMFACPTEALVMFPEGGVPPPLKIPEIDENFQTAVPGQYLIGEVAGKPLVKSAANLGRVVVEHMLAAGLRPGMLGRQQNVVDVAIVGSGPGGLSAALTCVAKGLSYVVLEKEQLIASTIARYPKGKLVMAEPYDTDNVSYLPVFDSSKEQLIPIWEELIERIGLSINRGESVEQIQKGGDGVFEVRSTVASYRAARVVLSIGTRGKPRTAAGSRREPAEDLQPARRSRRLARQERPRRRRWRLGVRSRARALGCRREGHDLVPRQGLQSRRAEEQEARSRRTRPRVASRPSSARRSSSSIARASRSRSATARRSATRTTARSC